MTTYNYTPQEFDIYIGNDVDQKSYALTVRDRYTPMMTKKIPADPEQLYNFIQRHFANQRVVLGYEAGPMGFGLHDYLTQRRQRCVLISPLSVPKASNQRVKTNRIDSLKIAAMLSDGQFKPVRVPEGPYRELRHLSQMRENYVRHRRTAKQRIKSLLLYTGLNEICRDVDQNWSNRYLEHLRQIVCSPSVRLHLDTLLADLDYARRQLLPILKQLKRFCDDQSEIRQYVGYLRSIPGIGFITATTLLGRIGDPRHLRDQRELAAFIGLVPREYSTGDQVRRGSITHLGDNVLRSLLIEAAWAAIHRDIELKQFYDRIKNNHPALYGARKAIVAVARKLTHRIYRVLKERREYIIH